VSDELLDQFVVEGRELTQQAAEDLFALEAAPGDRERLDAVFRALHTLKGSAGLFSFVPMEAALHVAEDLADSVRAGQATLAPAVIDALLGCVGVVEGWIDAVAQTGALPASAADQARELTARLRHPADGVAAPGADLGQPAWLTAMLARHPAAAAVSGLRYVPTPDCFFRGDDPLELLRGVPGLLVLDIRPREPTDPAALEPFTCNLVIEALSTAPADEIRTVFRLVPDQAEIATVPAARAALVQVPVVVRERGLRVDPARIDRLADIAVELVVAKNQLGHLARDAEAGEGLHRALLANQAEIGRLVGELTRAVAAARMVPLRQTLQRLPRLARDTAARLGKSVSLDLQGGETEADKRVADGLFEPLLHTLRNAIDHGIEPAPARHAAGKPDAGRIAVRAAREGDRLVIEVSDDGPGIDPETLRRTVLQRGLMSQQSVDALAGDALFDLIFMPGFSTAGSVTDISGRGVGLDAVRSSLAAMGGQVAVASVPGQGTTIRFTIPQAIVVTTLVQVFAGGQSFGIPIEAVTETLRLPATRVAPVREGAAFALRGATVPLLSLASLLGMERQEPDGRPDIKIVVVSCANEWVGIEVDGFGERLETVLRPLSGLLAGVPGLLGSALLGDGTVMLVLDLPGLIR
jgi:two-component system chemotaxis sensor kinase CheA